MPEFYMIFARKISKIPECYIITAQKYFPPKFGGHLIFYTHDHVSLLAGSTLVISRVVQVLIFITDVQHLYQISIYSC